jgi:thermitase
MDDALLYCSAPMSRPAPRPTRTQSRAVLSVVVIALAATLAAPAGARDGAPSGPAIVLARFADQTSVSKVSAVARGLDAERVGAVDGLPVQVLRVADAAEAAAVAAELAARAEVRWAHPSHTYSPAVGGIPNDPRFAEQYGLHNTGQQAGWTHDADIDGPEGWVAAGLGGFPSAGAGVPIGFVDTGIDKLHADLGGRVVGCAKALAGTGQVTNGTCPETSLNHGTHVAGIAAATANNGIGVAGVSFDSPILMCKVFNEQAEGTSPDVAGCIAWLHEQGAKVINMSLVDDLSEDLDHTMEAAVEAAWEGGGAAGSVLVAASGNSGNSFCWFPACFPEVVSVAATTATGARATFSARNAEVEVSAPGVSVLSTITGGYGTMSGTSMATPFAAGVAAVIWRLNPSFTAAQVRAALDAAVDDLGVAGRDVDFGFGRVNLCKAAGGTCGGGGGGDGAMTGVVTSGGSPVHKARVRVSGPETASVRTMADGRYTLTGLTPGTYTARANKTGCGRQTKTVTVTAGQTLTVDFQLAC